jgi:hypothetical protein
MSIPGISAAMDGVGVGVGSLPDISIPGISAAMLGVGVGSLPDISIPGMFIPAIPPEPLLDCALPASSNDVDLDSNAITAAKMATATPTDEIRVRLVPVLRAIEKSSQLRRVMPVA